ncbi:MAG: AAA family ATPase [Chloroflexi bacterium]|nr:AAA family ATPase [Chloroflexota bacterium]
MDQLPKPKQIASPVATGGVGSDFERRVGAYYLATLLLRSVPRGQDAGTAREVRFQRLYEGESLDDLVVLSDLPAGESKLALQIKRDLTFGEKDPTFDEVMYASWQTFKSSQFILGVDRFGVAVALYSKTVDEHYQRVLTWARTSANAADFLLRISIERLANRRQGEFVELIRAKLHRYSGRSVSEDELWNFLRSMVILHFDLLNEGSRDYAYSVEILRHSLPSCRKTDAPHLFGKLTQYAAEANGSAGSFDAANLTQRLQTDGLVLLPASDCRGDLSNLREHAEFILRDIRTDIGGLVLNRVDIVAEAQEKMREVPFLELIGPPGIGKSAVLKALVEMQRNEGHFVLLAGNRITGVGWDNFAHEHGLTRHLNELLLAISSSSQPCVFIDGIDRITTSGARQVVNDLLRGLAELPLSQDGSKHWTVIVSAREENLHELHTWLDWRVLGRLETTRIPELSQAELELVAKHCSRLRPLVYLERLAPVVRNPLMLRLLEDQRMLLNPESLPPIATEIEVSVVWWRNLVGRDGIEGHARQRALLKVGSQVVKSPGSQFVIEDIPPETGHSLESDRIFVSDGDREVYHFEHDLFEDWVLYRVLDQQRANLTAYLRDIGQPLGLFRSVQLLGLFLLERNETTDAWEQLVEQFEQTTNIAPKWHQALLTSPLLSPRAKELLCRIEQFLMAQDAQRLSDLLVALRTVEVNPDFSLVPIVERFIEEPDDLLPFLLQDPVPRWWIWVPLIGWLLERIETFPDHIRPEAAKLMEIWQTMTPVGTIHREEIGKMAFTWLRQMEEWHSDDKV